VTRVVGAQRVGGGGAIVSELFLELGGWRGLAGENGQTRWDWRGELICREVLFEGDGSRILE